MWAKIPFWVELALIFILPPMFLLDVMGLREVGWLLVSTILIYGFGMGAILGILLYKGRNFLKMLSKL